MQLDFCSTCLCSLKAKQTVFFTVCFAIPLIHCLKDNILKVLTKRSTFVLL